MKTKIYILTLCAGLLSSAISLYIGVIAINLRNVGPGLIFGLISLLLFSYFGWIHISWLKFFSYILISGIAYLAAVNTTTLLTLSGCSSSGGCHGLGEGYFSFFLGGIVGALILVLGAKYLLTLFDWKETMSMAILGGALGWSYLVPIGISESLHLYVLYLFWQIGMLLCMSKFIIKKFKQTAQI